MKLPVLLSAVLLLAGCAGPNANELLTEKPTQIINTTASVEDAKNCVVALDPAHYIPTPINGGWKIIDTQEGFNEQAAFVVMIYPDQNGSRVEYYRGHSPILGALRKIVQPCLDKLPRAQQATNHQ